MLKREGACPLLQAGSCRRPAKRFLLQTHQDSDGGLPLKDFQAWQEAYPTSTTATSGLLALYRKLSQSLLIWCNPVCRLSM